MAPPVLPSSSGPSITNEFVELVPLPVSTLLPLARGPPAAVPDLLAPSPAFVGALDFPPDLSLAFSETVFTSFYFGGVWPLAFPGLLPCSSDAIYWAPVASSSSTI